MAPTKDVANRGYRHEDGNFTSQMALAPDDVFRPSRYYWTRRQNKDAVVIESNPDIDFKSPLGQLGLLVSGNDNLVEYVSFAEAGDRFVEPSEGLARAGAVGFWHIDPEPGHGQWKECPSDSPSQIRLAYRQGIDRTASMERIKEFVRRYGRVAAKDDTNFPRAIGEPEAQWKGTGIRKLPGHVVSDIELQEAYQFALGNVIVDYPVAPEPELSPFIAIMQVARQPAAHELTISRREPLSDTHQSLTEDGNRVVREREKLLVELANAFDAMPFEDGIAHPAEKIIERALGKEDSFSWLLELVHESTHQSIVPSVLRCLGRMVDVGTEQWRVNLITNALASAEAESRDAAVQVVESWAGKDLLTVLESHNETVPWIRDYINDVLADLGA